IHSGPSSPARRLAGPRWCAPDADRSAAFFLWYALWLGRSSARGVGPLPSRPRRIRPPEPAVGLPLRRFRTAPRRRELPDELPGMRLLRCAYAPPSALWCVGDLDSGCAQLVADGVGGLE